MTDTKIKNFPIFANFVKREKNGYTVVGDIVAMLFCNFVL